MNADTWLFVAIGAALGAPCRFLVDSYVQHRLGKRLVLGTFAVNAIGSLVFGVSTALGVEGVLSADVLLFVGTGFCGALTTFSTFSFEVVRLIEFGEVRDGTGVIVSNTVVSIALAAVGYASVLALA